MKRIITGALALSMGSALAGNVMPEMTRDGKTKNDNLGLAWSKRKAAVISYDTLTTDNESTVSGTTTTTGENKTTNVNPYVFFNHGAISTEFSYGMNKTEFTAKNNGTNNDDDTNTIDLDVAYRISDMFAATVGYGSSKNEDTDAGSATTELNTRDVTLGFSYNHGNGMIAGLSYSLSNTETGTSTMRDVDYSVISLGAGYQNWNGKDGYSVEAFYQTRGKEEGDVISGGKASVGDMTNLELQATYAMSAWEIDFNLGKSSTETFDGTTEVKATSYGLDFEYGITSEIYVTPGYAVTKTETETTGATFTPETTVNTISLEAGYRTAMFDANIDLAKITNENKSASTTTTDNDGTRIAVNFGYFF